MDKTNYDTVTGNNQEGAAIPARGVKQFLFGESGFNLALGAMAIIILIGSFSVLAYTSMNEKDTDTLTVNGQEYSWDEVFRDFETRKLDGKEGVLLSDLVNDTGLEEPGNHEYRIVGADGYAKTVKWKDMENGIIMEDKECYFPELPKQFYVKDVVEIEVI